MAAKSLKKRVKSVCGDVRQIQSLMREAEQVLLDDPQELCQVYGHAMRAFGPAPLQTAPDDYSELFVKRLQQLCKYDVEEARRALECLRHYGLRQKDPRVLAVAADLEARQSGRRPSNTPIRPRTLRYSNCEMTAPLPEVPEEASGGADGGPAGGPAGALAAPQTARQTARERSSSARRKSRASGVESLSPIREQDSAEAEDHLQLMGLAEPEGGEGAEAEAEPVAELAEPAAEPAAELRAAPQAAEPDLAAQPAEADGKSLKAIVVNGVAYTKVQTVGRGGSSKVYQVQAPSGELRALKRVTASCPSHFEALANEVTLLQQLQDKPDQIIKVYDAEVLPDSMTIHIVMEMGERDMGRLLQSEPDIGLGDIQALWRQMLQAAEVIHERRIVHSDLKPANFMLAGGRMKLIDFGIAKRIASNTTHISREASVGTISYMAPEAVKAGSLKVGRPSDVWSLGIILYQIVYGRAPFAHLDPMQRMFALLDPDIEVEFPGGHRLQSHSGETKAQVRDVLAKCLQRDPKLRPTIPQLLAHPFLQDSVRVERRILDSAIEAVVAGFCVAVQDAVRESGGDAGQLPTDGEGLPREVCIQALSDEVWSLVVRGEARRPGEAADELEGLAPFRKHLRTWIATGLATKRQRLEEAPPAAGPTTAAAAAPSGAAAQRPRSGGPPRSGRGTGPPMPGAVRALPSASGAAAAPLRPAGPRGAANGPAGKPDADQLQRQRGNLRKAAAPGGKENAGAGRDQPSTGKSLAGATQENVVLRRLKDRRALVADDRAEETTEVTRWGHPVPGGVLANAGA